MICLQFLADCSFIKQPYSGLCLLKFSQIFHWREQNLRDLVCICQAAFFFLGKRDFFPGSNPCPRVSNPWECFPFLITPVENPPHSLRGIRFPAGKNKWEFPKLICALALESFSTELCWLKSCWANINDKFSALIWGVWDFGTAESILGDMWVTHLIWATPWFPRELQNARSFPAKKDQKSFFPGTEKRFFSSRNRFIFPL